MPVKPGKKKEEKSSGLFGSSTKAVQAAIYHLHGYPASGKTFAALMASKKWPKNLEAQKKSKKKILLDDVVYIGWDKGGLIGIKSYGIDVKYYIDMRDLVFKTGDLLDARDEMTEELTKLLATDKNIRVVIHDTISRFDSMLESYCFHPDNVVYARDRVTGELEVDGMRTYGLVARYHHEYQASVTTTPEYVTTLFLFHQKVLDDSPKGKATQQKVNQAKLLQIRMGDALVNVVPAITGKSLNVYTADCSMEFVMVKKGGKRKLFPEVTDGQRAKNRLEDVFSGPQPADMGYIIEKARKACS